jgi:hypothetical protein
VLVRALRGKQGENKKWNEANETEEGSRKGRIKGERDERSM